MAIGALGAGALGGAGVSIIISAVDRFSKTFAGVNKLLVGLGVGAVVAGALIAGGMVKAGKAAAIVETGYAKVNTLLEEGQDAQKLYGDFVADTNIKLGNQGDTITVLNALYQTQSAGITDVGESQIFLNAATIAAVGGSAELDTVVTLGTKTMVGFGLGVDDSTRIMDVFAGTVKAGQTTMAELAHAFPEIAGLAGEAGLTLEETAGTFAGLTKFMGSSDDAATSLSAVIRAFIKPSSDMEEQVKALGYESAASMLETLGLNESLKLLSTSVDGDTTALGGLFPNVRALKAVLPLTGGAVDDVTASIDTVTNSAGLSQQQFEVMANTIQYQWGQAVSAAQVMLEDIGRVINEVFVPVLEILIGWIKKLSDWWMKIPEPIKKTIVVVAGIVAGILMLAGVIMIVVGLKTLIVGMLVAATAAIWSAVTASLAFVAANIWWIAIVLGVIAVIGLLIAAGNWLVKNWDKVKIAVQNLGIFISNVWTGIKNAVISVWNFIVQYIENRINEILKLFAPLIDVFSFLTGIDVPTSISLGKYKGGMMEYAKYVPTSTGGGGETTVVNINNLNGFNASDIANQLQSELNKKISMG